MAVLMQILTIVGIFFGGLAVLAAAVIGILLAARKRGTKQTKISLDQVVGMRVNVTDRIDNVAGRGEVTVNGMQWAARVVSDDVIVEAGETVTVIAVEGVKLICK